MPASVLCVILSTILAGTFRNRPFSIGVCFVGTMPNRLPTSRETTRRLSRAIHAFTLVELLVVIAIIGVLISILVPTLSKARQSSMRTTCGAQLRDIGNAFNNYLIDSRGRLPDRINPLPLQAGADPSLPDLFEVFDRYLGNSRKIWVCPADHIPEPDPGVGAYDTYAEAYGVSYEYNFYLNALCPYRMFSKALDEGKRINVPADKFRIFNDLSHFHGPKGRRGNMNFLFADWHVSDFDGQTSGGNTQPGGQR